METVVAFNTELSGLYESKPPISKAKMTSITRSAMKAIKFYKHVVQSVEKFILKCKQEYKIPGLYVIDSIVRQSRHQFGTEKDVFAPRFARNMQTTFMNLFQCSPEDKSKIIRVLNLWQKNNVFAPDVIQPLFDLADPNHPMYQNQGASQDSSVNGMMGSIPQESPAPNMTDEGHTMSSDMSGPINSMSNVTHIDPSTLRHLQMMLMRQQQKNNEPVASTSSNAAQDSVKFNKKLLDFDYGDDEDDDNKDRTSPRQSQQQLQQNSTIDNNNISQLLNDPNVLRQLHNLQKLKQMEEKQSKLAEMRMQEEAFEKQLATMLKKLPFANECDLSRQDNQIYGMQNTNLNTNQNGPMYMASNTVDQDPDVELVSDDGKVEVINLDGNSRSPSIDRDRYKRRRSRSRSRGRRRRSRSRSRGRRGSSRDRDRKDREKDRDRKRRGLPEIKRDHLSVCSTTLWIGHLSKLTQQEELSDIFTKYGDIVSIDMIHPRGCAFLVMHRRQDAYKAIDGLNGYKLHGRVISISWAAGKGVKSKEWKDYWDLELGVSYIPWDKLDENTDFEQLEDGGMFDEDTMPQWLKDKLKNQSQKKDITEPAATVNPMANMMFGMDTTQPPPAAQMIPNMAPFPIGPPRFMPPMIGVPPPMNGQMPMMIPPPAPYFFPPMMPTQTIPSTASNANTSNTDDQMDLEEDESNEFFQKNQPTNPDPVFQKAPAMFNRPPPKIFAQNSMPPTNDVNSNNAATVNADDFRGRAMERDRDNRNRGNRENRRDSNERVGGNRNSNTRWSEGGRGRSRENDRTGRSDRRSMDNDKPPIHDRLRNVAPDGGQSRDFNNGPRNNMQWRGDNSQPNQMNFNNSYMDQSSAPPRPMNMMSGAPPALEDMRIPIPMDNLRGMPIGPMNNNKPNHGRRHMPPTGQPRDFYNQNRFGPPGMNGPPMNMMRGNMQQFGRNNNPMFMWQPRPGMNNNERPEGNFNRNDRNRGNMNQRGPRHWKDNDDGAPPSHKRNRNFDGPKDNNRNSYGNFNDSSNGKQTKDDGDHEGTDSDNRKLNENHDNAQATTGGDDQQQQTNKNDEKSSFPRIQIKSPSKLAQEFNEKQQQQQKQADNSTSTSSASATNDTNRTNNNKTAVDLNTTPLYDEPAEDRSYTMKEAPINQSPFDKLKNNSSSPSFEQQPPSSQQSATGNVDTNVSQTEINETAE